MSSDNGGTDKFDRSNESNNEIKRKAKMVYSREFLLSLSGLEKCKKLPSDFDESILREFEDASFERSRIPGSLLSHGFRRNEYASSPPTRDVGNYNRGRWESRSSGRIDKEADSKSDLDSDSGKHYTNPARRGWQAPEHDGLLGSGSFPRSSGYISGTSAPKFSPNENNQLNRSTEPYQPPRPYKAVPFRRETKDSFNDETFGASEITSEDKAEEERKRRDSFELMRQEHHKAFQEMQKMNTGKRKDVFDITTLLEDSRDEKRPLDKNSGINEPIAQESTKDPPKSSVPLQSVAARPLVPPGFAGAMQEKKSHPGEVKMVSADNISHASENIRLSAPPDYLGENPKADQMGMNITQHGRSPDIRSSLIGKGKTDKDVLPALDISDPPTVRKLFGSDMHPNALDQRNSEALELKSGKAVGNKCTDRPATILEELFGSPLTLEAGGFSTVAEQHGAKLDETWSPQATQSSKFAQWFLEEDRKPLNDPIPKPADLFSLIVGGERTASDFERQTPEQLMPKSPFLGSQLADDHMTSEAKITKSDSKPETVSAILTCEDLENAILSGIGPKMPEPMSPQPPCLQGWGGNIEDLDPLSSKNIDNGASQHLLSLLQKGMMHNGDAPCVPHADLKSSNKLDSVVAESVADAPNNLTEAHVTTSNLGQSLTLETLFGTAFMKELQSVGAPVSTQKGLAAGSALVDGILSSGETKPISSRNGHEVGFQGPTLQKLEEQFLRFENLQPQVNNAQLQAQVGPMHSIMDGHGGIRLPEEDSLIAVGDPLNPSNGEVLSSQGLAPFNIADKIAALNGNFIEQSYGGPSEGPLPFHVPFGKREPDPFQNHLHMKPHQQLRPHHPNHMVPNLDSQMKVLASPPASAENILHRHHDHMQQSRHHFPPNMIHPPPIHHPNTGYSSGFDSHNHHHLTQQMQMPGGHYPTPPHQFQGFVRGPPPQADNNRLPGLIHGMNPMQALQFGGQRHPIFGGINDPLLGAAGAVPAEMGGGGNTNNHPEALQRLIEMELRSNGNQAQHHPVPAGSGGVHTNQGLFGHERDLGFRYR